VQFGLRLAREFGGLQDGAVLQAPAIFTLSQWAGDLAARIDLLNGQAAPAAPDHSQLNRLWYTTVRAATPGVNAQEMIALARQARDADRLLNQWQLNAHEHPGGPALRNFITWRDSVREALQRNNWHSPEQWLLRLTAQLRGHDQVKKLLPDSVRLSGFIELTALEKQLLEALEHRGVDVTVERPPEAGTRSSRRQSFPSIEQEISAAARWAGTEMDKGCKRIAVIVNELRSLAETVRTIFENHLQAEDVFALRETANAPFRVSAGRPLLAEPLVGDALMLLRISHRGPKTRHDFPLISRLLLSPNWSGGAHEAFARARLECSLRAKGYYRWSLVHVAERAASSPEPTSLSRFLACLNGMKPADPSLHPARQLLAWLVGWGWPGDGQPQGAATTTQLRLLGLFERLSRQSLNSTGECLLLLEQMCGEDSVPGPGGVLSPIQVLSPEESYGLEFDSAWIANLTMENWPGRPINNPLLHTGLLSEIPRADHAGMLDYTERLTGALRNCAGEVRFSWCSRLEELPVSASPLINDLPEVAEAPSGRCTLWEALAPDAAGISGYRDHPWLHPCPPAGGRPYEPGPDRRLPRAVSWLNFQSACPLAAYLVFRLGAVMEPAPQPFTDEAWRGALVHAALERLYRPRIGSRERPGFEEVEAAVGHALESSYASHRLLPAELNALRSGTQELLAAWLEFESAWPGGRIQGLEWRQTLAFEGLKFDVRIDRADALEDGRLFLLDYKTGSVSATPPWADERPGDLQLPLYVLLLAELNEQAPAGMAIARVRIDGMKFFGLTDDESCHFRGISGFEKPSGKAAKQFGSWHGAVDFWRSSLRDLVTEVKQGDCRSRYYNPGALAYADLDILLRQEEGLRWRLEAEEHADS
jgi:probable DNA repair protein